MVCASWRLRRFGARVRWRALSEDNPGGRAAIRTTELLWRNEVQDSVACGGDLVFAGYREGSWQVIHGLAAALSAGATRFLPVAR